MVELHRRWVFEEVAPEAGAAFADFVVVVGGRGGVVWREKLVEWGGEATAHQRELVVHEAGVEAGDECA